MFGAEYYASLVNDVFSPQERGVTKFDPRLKGPPSMLKKAAQDWLESTGIADREEIYLVAAKFAETMRNQEVDVPDEVRHRFDVLLSYLASATDSQPASK